ncbi:MAG: glycolate oxidase subunit GlcF [Gammaproteobacteria bacterium]|uniref:glycolate oxidase subunit GlcF n=1 Tax=Rhodoferax sp. TaxID=50421 RepID=UPI0017BADC81|nr:glycolate oxidase subunit GlcF [Rhodoferax sp.]MBU3897341.1 glycolate oxidase subunit GlcF [Gammaproteobacteria bacterium]MBA3058642.1 glycolate oxidase subunit GlcF [Rhodoferax sp.]MBU3998309.1 glycolate oxidase subunit GlcF [Gammaproteobacteria bacterium]MBU4018687.1 glycolate oxidase subunit GlcF [Gammaproteobacteria bacterium]MBU4079642.1 glycolate oxidase subunit GlcF [Gammaproteobacteria bacterium]
MQTKLAPHYQGTADGLAAEAILRKCVHCGFCTATCPTYQLLGDELDSPRGRIYLMKQVLEGVTPTRKTQLHLDRCLTCRSCESTCPSGVQYGHLLDIGRKLVDAQVPRPWNERALRWVLKEGIPSPLFAPAMALGQLVRPILPAAVQAKVPVKQNAGEWPTGGHARQVLLLAGCVQPAMAPNIHRATARVLDAAGIACVVAPKAGCCGAVKFHLNDHDGGMMEMRANIDAWWPYLDAHDGHAGVEAILINVSGCGATVKDYGHILRDDPAYAFKAARISALTRDLSEWLPELTEKLRSQVSQSAAQQAGALVFHPPCTLQHGQQLRGGVERYLGELGFNIKLTGFEAHLCCGSAGTYSVLNPDLSHQLLERKLGHLNTTFGAAPPDMIVSANIGCITHLQSGTATPVRHWIEVLDAALAQSPQN